MKKEKLAGMQQDREERKVYGKRIFNFTACYSAVMLLIVAVNGFKGFTISDKVLITLITSTTASYFSFFLLVVRYLFTKNKH